MKVNPWTIGLILAIIAFSTWLVLTPSIHIGGFVREGFRLGLDIKGGSHIVLEADLSGLGPGESAEEAMRGAVEVIRRRIDAYGVAEAVIQRQPGGNRIIVQLPGVEDVEEAVKLIGQTAQLDFREPKLDENGNIIRDEEGNVKEWVPAEGIIDGKKVHLTGRFLKQRTQVVLDPTTNEPMVQFEWNKEGAKLFEQITSRLVGKPLGIFLDDQLISAPIVRSVITNRGVIEGLTLEEARLLSIQLNAGALPVPLKIIQQQDVSAILGADSLKRSLRAGIVGLALLLFFLIAYYRLPGFIAALALIFYGFLVLALFKLIPVTLTLAGIAGFIVSLGMAVDANVLIFERMKEELRTGRTLRAAIETGFSRAWTAIRDSNLTTFIACAVLYWFGSRLGAAPVMGFAVTLFLGVAVSMFTAIIVTRNLLRLALATPLGKRREWFKI